jgi:hypothetical protein
MDLKNFLPGGTKKGGELFWSLIIEPDWVQAGIWSIAEDKATVVASSSTSAWELENELIDTADAALSAAIQNLPEDIKEPSKVVFGVVSSWTKDGEIKEEYLNIIKKICKELSLTPVGFVVMHEAIANYIKSDEGSPLSGVVIGVSKESLEMSVFRLGNLVGTSSVARSVSVFDDVSEGLTRFAGDSLPSRFILYDGKEGELEDVRQSLLKASWDNLEVKFLHTPKIEIFGSGDKIQAISLAGAAELENVNSVQMMNEDDATQEKDMGEEVDNLKDVSDTVTPGDLGFSVGADIAAETAKQGIPPTELPAQEEIKEDIASVETEPNERPSKKLTDKLKSFKPPTLFKRKSQEHKDAVKKNKLSGLISRKPLVIGVVFLLLLIIGAFAAWWFYPKASVTIYLSTKSLDERIEITADPDITTADLENAIIPGSLVDVSVTGDKTKSTTGTKVVGESAKGEITLYRVGPSLNLPAGTVLNGPNDLKFTLDSDTLLASGSSIPDPGTTNASVTASDIGAQYNLASDTAFTISNYAASDISAKNSNAFSGGSSREIRAVSENDIAELEDSLTDELTQKAKAEIESKVGGNQLLIDESLVITEPETSYSNKVGDEATSLKLSMSMTAQVLVVDQNALRELAKEVLKDRVPDGFILRSEQIKSEFEYNDEVDGKYELLAKVEANLLPEIDPSEVSKKIAGRYPQLVKDFLTKEIPGFVRADIILKPKLPGRLGTLPHVADNIEIEIAAER